MSTFKNRWTKLVTSKTYRAAFVAAQVKQAIPYQIRSLLKEQKLSQEQLAERSGLTQGVISRAANPTYGNLSINTCVKIAAGFDVAFVGKFVPFSELDRWLDHLHDESIVPDFETENKFADFLFEKFDTPDHVDRWAATGYAKTPFVHIVHQAAGQLGFGATGAGNSLLGGGMNSLCLVVSNARVEDSHLLANQLNEHQPITDQNELQTAEAGG